VIYNSN